MEAIETTYTPLCLDPKAYRFFPKSRIFIKAGQQEKSAFEKKGTRFYFHGQIEHDEYQQRKIKEFHEYIHRKQRTYNHEFFDEQKLLLFLSANKYKPKDTLKAMQEHLQFKLQFLPTLKLEKFQALLRKGYMYVSGRDKHFRPLMIYTARLIEPGTKVIDPYFEAIVYLQEEILRNMFIPGQVESWNVIYDLSGLSLSDLPLSNLKKILERISLNYGGRLFRLWVLNAPSGVSTTWKLVSTVLDDVTVDKIKISKTPTQESIFDWHDKSQVEEKFGGTQPNRKEYFPFSIPPGVFEEKRLLSNQEYEKLLQSGKLKRNVIDPLFAQKKQVKA